MHSLQQQLSRLPRSSILSCRQPYSIDPKPSTFDLQLPLPAKKISIVSRGHCLFLIRCTRSLYGFFHARHNVGHFLWSHSRWKHKIMRPILLHRQVPLSPLHRPQQIIQHLLAHRRLGHTYGLAPPPFGVIVQHGAYIVCDGRVSATCAPSLGRGGNGPVISLRLIPSHIAPLSLIDGT